MSDYLKSVGIKALDWILAFMPRLATALIIAFAGWFVAGKVRQALVRAGKRLEWDEVVTRYLASTARYVILALFFITAANKLNLPVSSLLTTLGVSGVIMGLGLRGQVSNYFSGLMLLGAKPFTKGDLIEFGPPPQLGTVRELRMMYTVLDSPDNVRLIVPNSVLWRNRIYNFSTHDRRAINIHITIPYADNVQWVESIAMDVLARHPAVSNDPKPTFTIANVGPENVKALICAWSEVVSMNVFGEVITEMRKEFETAGLEVTVPSNEIDLKREE